MIQPLAQGALRIGTTVLNRMSAKVLQDAQAFDSTPLPEPRVSGSTANLVRTVRQKLISRGVILPAKIVSPTTSGAVSSANATSTSVVLVPGLPPVNPPGNSVTSGTPSSTTPSTPQSPMAVLSAALLANGIDPASLGLVQTSTPVYNPGGPGWINNLISMVSPTGQHNFTVELMMINPQVTVNEIKNILAGKDSPSLASLTGHG